MGLIGKIRNILMRKASIMCNLLWGGAYVHYELVRILNFQNINPYI